MSYILDALRKADQQRRLSRVPTLQEVYAPGPKFRPRLGPWAVTLAIAVNVAVLAGLLHLAGNLWRPTPLPPLALDSGVATAPPARSAVPAPPAPTASPAPPAASTTAAPPPSPPSTAPARAPAVPSVPATASPTAPPSLSTAPAESPHPPAPAAAKAAAPMPAAPAPEPRALEPPGPASPGPPPARGAAPVPVVPAAPAAAPSSQPSPAPSAPPRPASEAAAAAPSAPAPSAPPPVAVAAPSSGFRQEVERLTLDVLVYADTPAQRLVFISGKRYGEGDQVEGKYLVEAITVEGAVLTHEGQRLLLRPKSNPYIR